MKTEITILVAQPTHPSGAVIATVFKEAKRGYLCVMDYLNAEANGDIKIVDIRETTIPSYKSNVIYTIVEGK